MTEILAFTSYLNLYTRPGNSFPRMRMKRNFSRPRPIAMFQGWRYLVVLDLEGNGIVVWVASAMVSFSGNGLSYENIKMA